MALVVPKVRVEVNGGVPDEGLNCGVTPVGGAGSIDKPTLDADPWMRFVLTVKVAV